MARSAIRATTLRPDASAPEKKVRLRKNASQRSMLDIPTETLEELGAMGIDLQWVTDTINGEPFQNIRNDYEVNAWEPVSGDMWNGMFDGMFMKKGHKGEINFGGLVLMWRPMELTLEAREEDQKARNNALAAQAAMLKSGQIPGFSPGFEPDHPTAIRGNMISRTVRGPMDIPKD